QLKIDAEYPRFTQGLMSILAPHLLAPTPSLAIVQLQPNPNQGVLTSGFKLPRSTTLKSNQGRGESACEYRTSQEVELWPIELVVLLDRRDATIEAVVSAEHVALFCTPVANLFPKRTDRIHLNERENEYHVVVDRTRPLDFEVYSLTSVVGVGATPASTRPFL